MAETKIIPLELKKLVCCHLFHDCQDDQEGEMTSQPENVVPLDLGQIRKTQRRVAALLNNSKAAEDAFSVRPRKRLSNHYCYVCSGLSRHRQSLGKGYAKKCDQVPPAPHASFVNTGAGNSSYGQASDVGPVNEDGGLFDTEILRSDADGDPHRFLLPPVFNRGQLVPRKSKGVVPTVSENTFVTSNYRTRTDAAFEDDVTVVQSVHNHNTQHNDVDNGMNDKSTSSLKLPRISQERNLVTNTEEEDIGDGKSDRMFKKKQKLHERTRELQALTSREGHRKIRGSDDLDLTSRSEPHLLRAITLESERTGGSLLMDEDYVPMSVTIKRLAEADIRKTGQSPYTDYSEFLSTSSGSAGDSRGVSREPTLLQNDLHQRLQSADRCECPQGLQEAVSCPECHRVKGHTDGCSMTGSMICQMCLKPRMEPSAPAHVQRQRSFGSRDFSNLRQSSSDLLILSQLPASRDRSDTFNKHGKKKPLTSKSRKVHTRGEEIPVRVRFDASVHDISLGNKVNDLPTRFKNDAHVENSDQLFTKRDIYDSAHDTQNAGGNTLSIEYNQNEHIRSNNRPKSLDDTSYTKIATLGVNVHKAAYILALQDTRRQGPSNKRKKSKRGRESHVPTSQGTIFSYFPLLKRPYPDSIPEKPQQFNLGLKQNEGARVKPRKAMKHIFGKVKLGDYYPGGRKWRPLKDYEL